MGFISSAFGGCKEIFEKPSPQAVEPPEGRGM